MNTKPKCCQIVLAPMGRGFISGQCSNSGKVHRCGKWYCRIHDPDAVSARRKIRDDSREAEEKADEEVKAEASDLAAALGVDGYADWNHSTRRQTRNLVISFADAAKLIERLKEVQKVPQ